LPNDSSPEIPPESQDRALQEARDDFERILHPDGKFLGEEDYLDRSEQIGLLEKYGREQGWLYEGLEPVAEGGREHDITFDEGSGTVLKFTKASCADYIVDFFDGRPRLSNGDPIEYLDRLILHDELFGEMTRLVLIGGVQNHRRIITRQRRTLGRPASKGEIQSLMIDDLGFKELRNNYGIGYEESLAFIREDAAAFDLRPANVFITDEGLPVVFDSIPVRITDTNRSSFR
jgi:hypothetical protein